MKTLALALLIPVTICAACGDRDNSMTTSVPATPDEAVDGSADSAAPATFAGTASDPSAPDPDPAAPGPLTSHVDFIHAGGSQAQGALMLVNQGSAVSLRGQVTGLSPGTELALIVHEVGECAPPDFASAGGEFNPTGDPEGGAQFAARNREDLPHAVADENGRAIVNADIQGVTFLDVEDAPTEILGKALVVHAMPDDFQPPPSGELGPRIACGVIHR